MGIFGKLMKFGLSFFVILIGLAIMLTSIPFIPVLIGVPGFFVGLGLTGIGFKWLVFK